MYICCFGFGREENIAMWANYGKPKSKAVRLRFPAAEIKKLVDNLNVGECKIYTVRGSGGDFEYESIDAQKCEISFHDVGYVSNSKTMIAHCRSYYKLPTALTKKDCGKESCLSSYLKKQGWAYEHETRLVIKVPHKLFDSDGKTLRNIAIDFGTVLDVLKEAPESVVAGPWFDRSPYIALAEILPPSCIKISDYAGMVDFGDFCDKPKTDENAKIVFSNCTFNINL